MKHPLPRVGEAWVTPDGHPVELFDLGDPKLDRMHRRVKFRRGGREFTGYTVANFIKRFRPVETPASLLLPCPAPGETWATEDGMTCKIVDGGDPAVSRRERRVTFDRAGRGRCASWRVSCFMYYWTRIE